MKRLGVRWLKFNAVGIAGVLVQLAALALFHSVLGIHYLAATALAVEIAVLHNFAWHERWTWRDRPGNSPARLARFNATTGLLSIGSNLILMRLFAGALGIPYLAANLLAIAVTSMANFVVSELFVFRVRRGPQNAAAAREPNRELPR